MIFCGAIDTHHILLFDTPEVGGEYLLEPVHPILANVTAENVWRWWMPPLSSEIMTDLRDGMETLVSLCLQEVSHVC
jgi:hypothetical protein